MRKTKNIPQKILLDHPIKIDRLSPTGQGVGVINFGEKTGKKIFLWNTLPGETVLEYTLLKSKSSFEEGIATKFEFLSEHRVEPLDKQFLSTSPWQIMNSEAEKYEKEKILQEIFYPLFNEIGQRKIPLYESSKNYFYRNKMEYSLYFNNTTKKIELGIHRRGSHQKIPIESSSIERPEIFQKAQEIIKTLNDKGEEARKYQSLLLRCNQSGQVEGGLYENHKPHPTFNPLNDTLLNYEYSYSPNGFFQINLPVYEQVLIKIKSSLKPDIDNLIDLYSGVGTIGLSVGRDKNLTLVEVDKSAFSELEKNVKSAKNLKNATPVLAKSEEALDFIRSDAIVILDPPRAGCDNKLIDRLNEVKPPQVIYLSCNPATQVRDLQKLTKNYEITSIETYNFFPKTPHIENLVILNSK